MRKIMLIVGLVCLIGLCACNKTENAAEGVPVEQQNEIVEQQNEVFEQQNEMIEQQDEEIDGMAEYIKSLAPENRKEFLSFWKNTVIICEILSEELEDSGKKYLYKFDPTDSEQVPEEINKMYDLSEIAKRNYNKIHKDFVMIIQGTEVALSFDGIDIYPTEYSYNDIQNIIKSLE